MPMVHLSLVHLDRPTPTPRMPDLSTALEKNDSLVQCAAVVLLNGQPAMLLVSLPGVLQ